MGMQLLVRDVKSRVDYNSTYCSCFQVVVYVNAIEVNFRTLPYHLNALHAHPYFPHSLHPATMHHFDDYIQVMLNAHGSLINLKWDFHLACHFLNVVFSHSRDSLRVFPFVIYINFFLFMHNFFYYSLI